MYEYILFDLDGTLTDPGEGITNSVAYALEKFGITENDRTRLYAFIGPPLADSFAKYYGMTAEECERAIFEYRVYFKDRGMFENAVYPDVEQMLDTLKKMGKTICLATSKPEEFAVTILKHFGLHKYFDVIGGASMDGKRSAKGDVIRYTLEKGGITDLSRAVMIGDRKHDIMGAKSVGMASAGVLYGYGDEAELKKAGADYILSQVSDIISIV